MREILFKAKCIDNGEWVEGYLIKIWEDDYRIATQNDIDNAYTKHCDYDGYMTRIDPNTIGQYTGLTDKNGNKIWENDVVKDKYLKYRVVWDEEEGSWMLESISGARYSVAGIGRINSETFEVIGNIFDGEFQNDSEGTKKD